MARSVGGALAVGLSMGAFVAGLARRAVTSEAVCISTFGWMSNSLSQSPCIVAGYLLSSCAQSGDWTVQAVTADSHYTPPNSTNENGCACSWAVYNTMQACADCQGLNFETAMLSWSGWSGNCSSNYLSNTEYYPSNVQIPDGTAIPFWATTNPSTWLNGEFDPTTAQGLANENKNDVTQSYRNGGGKTNTGAIAGGVVGGVIVVAVLGLVAFFLVRRNRMRRCRTQAAGHTGIQFSPLHHARSNSDLAPRKYYDTTTASPSPGPTLPVSSIDSNGYGFARPPFHSVPSNNSFASFPTSTVSPPPPPLQDLRGLTPKPMSMPMVALNPSTATLNSARAGPGHAHTRSGSSGMSGAFSMGHASAGAGASPEGAIEPFVLPPTLRSSGLSGAFSMGNASAGAGAGASLEGTIEPFVLPPTLPEPMGPDEGAKGGSSSGGGEALFTSAARKAERRNPPAYSPGASDTEAGTHTRDSMEVQAADSATQAMSGTTLLQSASGTLAATLLGTQADQSVVPDGSSSVGHGHGHGHDRYGYPANRKNY